MPDIPRIKRDDLVSDYPGVFETARHVGVGIGWLGLIRTFVEEALPRDPALCILEVKGKWAAAGSGATARSARSGSPRVGPRSNNRR